MTLVDSLDTLWLMGLKDEFWDARDYVRDHLRFGSGATISVFETTIRALGGLLSAFDLSRDRAFLNKAEELGLKLLGAFKTNSGLPHTHLNLGTGKGANGWAGDVAILSELGSTQLEFRFLAEATGKRNFEESAMKPFQVLSSRTPPNGLMPIRLSLNSGALADRKVTFGALGDSYYEYLLKVWLQGGKQETWLRALYDRAVQGAFDTLLQVSRPSGLAYFGDWNGRSVEHKMDHLVCFMPGVLALGAVNDPLGQESERAQRDMKVAKAMMYTCYQMYKRTKSGLSGEYVEFRSGSQDFVYPSHVKYYILRPETAESLFVLHQVTGQPIYREWAWEIFQAIWAHCRTDAAFGALKDIDHPARGVDDRMESFMLAETLKYLYLIQEPEKKVDLSTHVLTTEAHVLRNLNPSHRAFPAGS